MYGVIFAAGLGTRLLPLTKTLPKPLVQVAGKPAIFYILESLKRFGVSDIIMNTHHLAPVLQAAVGSSFEGIPVHYSHEPQLLDTGGGLKHMWELIPDKSQPLICINGDIYIELDLKLLWAHVQRRSAVATMVLKSVDNPQAYGAVGTDPNDHVKTIGNRLVYKDGPLQYRMFCGIHVLSPRFFTFMDGMDGAFSILDVYEKTIRAGLPVDAYDYAGYFCDLGTPERLAQCNRDLMGTVT